MVSGWFLLGVGELSVVKRRPDLTAISSKAMGPGSGALATRARTKQMNARAREDIRDRIIRAGHGPALRKSQADGVGGFAVDGESYSDLAGKRGGKLGIDLVQAGDVGLDSEIEDRYGSAGDLEIGCLTVAPARAVEGEEDATAIGA